MKWAVFISGTGSNLTSLMDAMESWEVALVVTNKDSAPGALRVRRRGVPVWLITKKTDWVELATRLKQAGIESIALAGFMRIVPPEFLRAWTGPILNLHPSLLPAFPGLESIKRSFEAGSQMGVTVHHVVEDVDAGNIILQKQTSRRSNLEESELRLHIVEQRSIQKGVQLCDQR
jgi:phosphoribosylglycinamide formyltransferase-1